MPQSLDIVALGHILNERIVFPDQTTKAVLGSPVAYSMVCCARLGGSVGIVTHIGTDYPQELLRPFGDAGVQTQGLICEGPDSTTNRLVYDENGDKQIFYEKKAPDVCFEDIPESYLDAQLFYVCPMDYEVSMATVERIRGTGALVGCDVGGYGGAHVDPTRQPPMVTDPEGTKELFGKFDVLKASDEDCRKIMGDRDVTDEEMAHHFLDWGVKVAVITRGEKGSYAATADAAHAVPAFSGTPVDPTGGGDTYMAGFLTRYLQTRDVLESARFASMTALLVIEQTGGVQAARMPTFEQVSARMASATTS